jgi:hypothetical protein
MIEIRMRKSQIATATQHDAVSERCAAGQDPPSCEAAIDQPALRALASLFVASTAGIPDAVPAVTVTVAMGPPRVFKVRFLQHGGVPSHRDRPGAEPIDTLATTAPRATAPLSLRLGFTGLVALAEAAHLTWEHLDGGIVSHNLLNDPTLPALWNGWGLAVLPALAWIASRHAFDWSGSGWRLHRPWALRLLCALSAGIALAASFWAGREDASGALLIAVALSAFFVRAYRPEYLLGFALGMALTFGGLLPVLIGGVIALLSAVAWFGVYPLLTRALRREGA